MSGKRSFNVAWKCTRMLAYNHHDCGQEVPSNQSPSLRSTNETRRRDHWWDRSDLSVAASTLVEETSVREETRSRVSRGTERVARTASPWGPQYRVE